MMVMIFPSRSAGPMLMFSSLNLWPPLTLWVPGRAAVVNDLQSANSIAVALLPLTDGGVGTMIAMTDRTACVTSFHAGLDLSSKADLPGTIVVAVTPDGELDLAAPSVEFDLHPLRRELQAQMETQMRYSLSVASSAIATWRPPVRSERALRLALRTAVRLPRIATPEPL